MQLIRCTQKLLKELNHEVSMNEPDAGILGGWHANLYKFERRKCVLATNDKTLYSVFMPCLRKSEFIMFPEIFREQLSDNLIAEGFAEHQVEAVLGELKEIGFAKTNNRSVLGSMNDYGRHIEFFIDYFGGLNNLNLIEINKKLNRMIMGALKYSDAVSKVSEILKSI